MAIVPNWQHNSNKPKTTKGQSKAQLKARKQALNHLKNKYSINIHNRHHD